MQVPLLSVWKLPLARVSCFCKFSHHGLDPFAHTIFLLLDSGSSVKSLAVDIYICIHQLLGSMLTVKVVISLITGEGQFRYPFHYSLKT